ncbi:MULTISPECIES: thiol-disulfide oxidoreductase DCC family protein [Haloarcula]|uniref:thiol-disulfide oxidoreductase DCC family protein n=1 Tax=Haloarcula TaxID=2237 RepID=UPI0023ECF223|nr:thiol-disulfide oxidoreductase DCC family protein [Halomicroarcula sp. XH51]
MDPPAETDRDAATIVDELDQPLLLFDGVCNLCNGFVRFVVQFDDAGEFLFAPLQSDVGQELSRRHGLETEDFDTVVLVEDGQVYKKSEAVLRVSRRLDGPWPLLSAFSVVPTRVSDRVYDLVAENRYRVFGKKDACPVPEPEIRDRFANRTFE